MISHASVTHFMNSGNNRFLELPFEQYGDQVNAQSPLDSVSMPNGYYMVFAMVDDIPSEAMIVKIANDSISTSTEACQASHKLNIFPNPANTFIYMNVPQKNSGAECLLYIIDSEGKLVIHKEISLLGYNLLNIAHLPAGAYHVKVMTGDQNWSSKLIKI